MSGKIVDPTDKREWTDDIHEETECCQGGACCWHNTPAQSEEEEAPG